eukprot:CAMPEP_0172696478 /NCGR_PEP_ID=MMETSP1074-20121228/28079_1 /TAXON_ID=2916 /ORGANISM="Ceratium fusus, Strain PA161109" /LENGTH=129 /DNA_ID=CAMNT_0013517229 /DNA_START=55 /DNA_END=440 /DNA_ORIENTATION=-
MSNPCTIGLRLCGRECRRACDDPRRRENKILSTTTTTTTVPFVPSSDFTCSGAAGCGHPFIGVNLGGWLVLEDWMWYSEMLGPGIKDEWTFIQHHGGPHSVSAIAILERHWDTFVTEKDLDRLLAWGVT